MINFTYTSIIRRTLQLSLDCIFFLADDLLWNDILLTACEEKPKETLTTVLDEMLKKKALELGRACFMFTSVLMRPTGVQYHIDLAQNILTTAMSSDLLKNELYANLIKLTSGSMSYGIQVYVSSFSSTYCFLIGITELFLLILNTVLIL